MGSSGVRPQHLIRSPPKKIWAAGQTRGRNIAGFFQKNVRKFMPGVGKTEKLSIPYLSNCRHGEICVLGQVSRGEDVIVEVPLDEDAWDGHPLHRLLHGQAPHHLGHLLAAEVQLHAHLTIDNILYRVVDPHWFQCISGSGSSSESRVWMTKNWTKFTAEKNLYFFGKKTAIYLSLGLHKGRTIYRRSLQPSEKNIQHFKTWKFFTFSILVYL